MKSNLLLVPTRDMTEEQWLAWRMNGIGGSEVGTVMMLNKYQSRLQLYEEKVGLVTIQREENELMFWGTELEEQVAQKWQYYDGIGMNNTERNSRMINNFREKKIIRKCRKLNAFVVNPDYPELFASVDRLINKGQPRIFDGDISEDEAVLECKNIRSYVAKMWEDDIPPAYAAQVQTYLNLLQLNYGEMAILKDGGFFDVIPFYRSEEAFEAIYSHIKPFWEKIMYGRHLLQQLHKAEAGGNMYEIQNWQAQLQANEPEPDGTEALEQYLKDKYKVVPETMQGDLSQLQMARAINGIKSTLKDAEDKKRLLENSLKQAMASASVLDFGEHGKITWNENKNKVRTFRTDGIK